NIESIHSPFSKATSNWWTKTSSKRSGGSASTSRRALEICSCRASVRNSWRKNGPASRPPCCGSGSNPQQRWKAAQGARQKRRTKRRSAETMACIEAQSLHKAFGTTIALDSVTLRVEEGRILGLIGPNGAGKTTALNAFVGLTPCQGELRVLGRNPWTERDQ